MRVGTFLVVCVLLFVSCEEKRVAIGGLPFQITRGEEWGIIGMNGEIKMINAFAHRPSALVNERLSVPDDSGKYGLYSFSGELKSVSPKSFTTIGYFFEEVTLAQEKKNEPWWINSGRRWRLWIITRGMKYGWHIILRKDWRWCTRTTGSMVMWILAERW